MTPAPPPAGFCVETGPVAVGSGREPGPGAEGSSRAAGARGPEQPGGRDPYPPGGPEPPGGPQSAGWAALAVVRPMGA